MNVYIKRFESGLKVQKSFPLPRAGKIYTFLPILDFWIWNSVHSSERWLFMHTWKNSTFCGEGKIETCDYKTVWQLKCKWIKNMWIKLPLKHTWFLKIKRKGAWQQAFYFLPNPKHLKNNPDCGWILSSIVNSQFPYVDIWTFKSQIQYIDI